MSARFFLLTWILLIGAAACDSSSSTEETLDAATDQHTSSDTQPQDTITPQPERLESCDFEDSATWEATCNASDCSSPCCTLGCGPGGPSGGCPALCSAAGCSALSAEQCPSGPCQIMTDCAGRDRCFHLFSGEAPTCGDVSSYRQDVPCCAGLEKRCGAVLSDGTCDLEGGGYLGFSQCLACGDGACDPTFENACSCPEDCP